jgi:acyl carrier protein
MRLFNESRERKTAVAEYEEILERVRVRVAETLGVDAAEVTPTQRFFTDLNGESIEWLDLSFRLDKEFGARIPGVGNFANGQTDAESHFTASGLEALRAFLPASLLDRAQDRGLLPTPKELAEQITVSDIAGMVVLALEAKQAARAT